MQKHKDKTRSYKVKVSKSQIDQKNDIFAYSVYQFD